MLVGLLPDRFKNVYDAIADTKSFGGFSIQKGKYLDILSTEEAKNLPCGEKIRKCNKADGAEGNYWWLRTQGTGSSGAAYVNGNTGEVIASGTGGTNTMIFGIRPVLQLDLSKVYFSTKTNTFALEPFTYNVAITGGANAARSGGAAPQTVADGNAMNTVTYTANKGFHFEQFTTITNNGVSVSRNGDTVVTVSGTPTADVSITVPNAVVISTTTPEPGTDDSNPSQTTGSEDNGSSNTEQAQYNQDSDQTDTAEVQPVETIDKTQKGTTLSKPKAGKKSVTLSWKKQTAKGIKGYEIQYSTDKSFSKDTTKTKTINKSKTTKLKIKGLKSKTKYFIRIRTFSKKNGEKVYSRWSNVKNVKVK